MADDDGELELGADDGDGDADVAVEHLPWAGETIDAADALLERALSYGMYVNKGRALPDVRDGLKPVQRRIITAMDELGARAGRPYVKSAQVIGEVIGNYHPHGDAPVYDAMVRLAQSFSLNVPLVDGQGNWGSVGPKEYSDPAAAYRYTEARLTAATTDWLADLRPQVVEYRPNFTEKKLEPFVLPVTFPNLLVNGSRGIGWSMACEIPPHNLAEACAAAVTLAENPDAALADLLAAMPGPDFPTGGIVVDPDGLAEAYERGSGTFRLQAKFHVEQLPGNLQAVVVTELPFGVSPDQIVAEVVRAARAERITDVTELPKNLSDRSGIRVQIRCKRGGNVTKLIADLMRLTSLRITVGINMTVLVDGAPRQLGLRDALDAFVTFRFEVVTNRLKHERTELLRELKRLVALLAALDAIDRVVQIIRSAEDDDDAREQLKLELKVRLYGAPELVPIDDEQAQQILDMPLKRLTRLNKLRLQEEVAKKAERVDEIDRILDSFDALRAIVVGELRETAKRYGTARRTVLGGESRLAPAAAVGAIPSGPLRVRDLAVVAAPRTDVVLFATASGACTTRPREARLGRVPLNVGATDAVVHATATDTESELNAFSSDGQVYRLRVADVPIEGRISRGVKAVGLGRGASLAALCPVEPAEGYLLLVTAGGEVKRAEAAVFAASHLGGSPALDLPAGDALVAVVPHADADDILLQSAGGKTLRIEAAKLRPVKSPAAGGVAGMRLDAGDRVVAACVARGDVLVLAHERGNGKAIALADIPRKGRGTGGVQGAATDAPRREPAGPVAVAVALAAGETALLMTASGGLTRVAAADVEVSTRAAVSRVLVEVAAGDRVSGAALAP